jgi:hypothetical protein
MSDLVVGIILGYILSTSIIMILLIRRHGELVRAARRVIKSTARLNVSVQSSLGRYNRQLILNEDDMRELRLLVGDKVSGRGDG